jgi:hypothetical protein
MDARGTPILKASIFYLMEIKVAEFLRGKHDINQIYFIKWNIIGTMDYRNTGIGRESRVV